MEANSQHTAILHRYARDARDPVFFYGLIYIKQEARDIPFVIWDEDNSAVSRQIIYLLRQSETISVTGNISSEAELKSLVQQNKTLGAIHFPFGMEKSILTRHPSTLTLYTNAASLVPAKLVYKAVAQVVITASAGVVIQKLVKTGMNRDKAMALANPIKLNSFLLYNPTYNYQEYLVPGLITVTMQMILIISSMLCLNFEWRTNTIHELSQLAGGSSFLIIISKTIAHLTVAWINFVLIVGVIFPVFQIGVPDATANFFFIYTLLSIACIGIGMFISALLQDVTLAGDVALFYTSPAFVFSGFTFPRWAMPWYDQYYAMLMPYTHFLDAFFKSYYMNLPLHYSEQEIYRLLIFVLATFPTAGILFKQQLKNVKYEAL